MIRKRVTVGFIIRSGFRVWDWISVSDRVRFRFPDRIIVKATVS